MVGKILHDKNIQKVFCSSQQRCKDTLEIIQTQNPNFLELKTLFDDNLRECNYGKIEGMDENIIRTQLLLQGIDRRDPVTKFNLEIIDKLGGWSLSQFLTLRI
jgi:broad specificity phosphatase PhoE